MVFLEDVRFDIGGHPNLSGSMLFSRTKSLLQLLHNETSPHFIELHSTTFDAEKLNPDASNFWNHCFWGAWFTHHSKRACPYLVPCISSLLCCRQGKPALCSQLFPVGACLNSGFAVCVPGEIGGWSKSSTSSLWQGEQDEHPMLRTSPLGSRLSQDLLTYLPKLTAQGRRLQRAKVNQG